jgi:hypothetical protein
MIGKGGSRPAPSSASTNQYHSPLASTAAAAPAGNVCRSFPTTITHFEHPSGLAIEVIEDPNETRAGWRTMSRR